MDSNKAFKVTIFESHRFQLQPASDLRHWLDFLQDDNDLWIIEDEVKPEPDIGAIGKAISDTQGPAALIKNVRGYKSPLAIGVHGAPRRVAKALGLEKDANNDQVIEAWSRALSRYPVKSVLRSDGTCKENIVKGDKVNLFDFPLHRLNSIDGSFFISKGCLISKGNDNDIVNVGIYRMMVLGKNKTAIMMQFDQHAARHFVSQEEKGKPLQISVSIGNEPVLPMVAGAKMPYEWSEFDVAGAVRESPYELTKSETSDLPVPAHAEIILEGVIEPHLRVFEGPFGEFPGAYTGYFYAPIFTVKAITHRDNPIYETLYIGRPDAEHHYMTRHSKLATLTNELRKVMPKITRIAYLKPYIHVAVIQGKWTHTGDPKQAINLFWGVSLGRNAKITVCVDEDVNPWDASEVMWAISTRVSSSNDIFIMHDAYQSLDPAHISGVSIKIGIDATKPRPPYLRFKPVDWIDPPKGTDQWIAKIMKMKKENRDTGVELNDSK